MLGSLKKRISSKEDKFLLTEQINSSRSYTTKAAVQTQTCGVKYDLRVN
jgi:hypothetical protein